MTCRNDFFAWPMNKSVKKTIHKKIVSNLLGRVIASDQDIHQIVTSTLDTVGLKNACISRSGFAKLVDEDGFEHCLEKIALPHASRADEQVTFYRCKFAETVQASIDANSEFATLLLQAIDTEPCRVHPVICYHDECTAGNVVQVASSQKASFFYFALAGLDSSLLHHEEMWFPLACIQHISVKDVLGGFSAVWKAVVQSLLAEKLQNGIALKFTLPGDDGQPCETHRLLLCSIGTWVADLDAVRLTWDCKGSAALRPCFKCRNVLKRDSGIPEIDSYFIEVDCPDTRKFDMNSDESIFEMYDSLLAEEHRTKKAAEQASKLYGFWPNIHGALACKEVREACPPSMFLFDPMHCYYSNGCAAWEVNLLLHTMEANGISRSLLESAITETVWENRTGLPHTENFRRHLVCEAYMTGDCYKGGAKELDYLMPLLAFCIFGSAIKDMAKLKKALESFRCLMLIRRQMSDLKHKVQHSASGLNNLQQEHQQLFKEAYGYERLKPKHHVRMHLPKQFDDSQVWVDTLSMEKRHRVPGLHVAVSFSSVFCTYVYETYFDSISFFDYSDFSARF